MIGLVAPKLTLRSLPNEKGVSKKVLAKVRYILGSPSIMLSNEIKIIREHTVKKNAKVLSTLTLIFLSIGQIALKHSPLFICITE